MLMIILTSLFIFISCVIAIQLIHEGVQAIITGKKDHYRRRPWRLIKFRGKFARLAGFIQAIIFTFLFLGIVWILSFLIFSFVINR